MCGRSLVRPHWAKASAHPPVTAVPGTSRLLADDETILPIVDAFYWTMSGRPAGFSDNGGFWAANGRFIGRFVDGLVFDAATGMYVGEVYGDDRVLRDPRKDGRRRSASSRPSRSARSRSHRYAPSIPSGKVDWPIAP